jgi:LPXTG-site transpeptidase (sortase) family protein
MLGRVSVLIAGYVSVGFLLAVGGATGSAVADPPRTEAAPATTTTSTSTTLAVVQATTTTTVVRVPWASARLAEVESSGPIPVSIEIPSIQVSAEVVASGIDDESGQMEIPATAAQVGWYRFGPRPGEDGSAVLAGHVDMAGQGPGAFFHLDRLVAGDEVEVHLSDGTVQRFAVVETVRVPKDQLNVEAIFSRHGGPRLTLVTCGGAFNHTERSYDDNVVTSLKPLGATA